MLGTIGGYIEIAVVALIFCACIYANQLPRKR